MWRALQKIMYGNKISDTDWLKRVIINRLAQINQDILNSAIDQLPKRYMTVFNAKCVFAEFRLDQFCVHMILLLLSVHV